MKEPLVIKGSQKRNRNQDDKDYPFVVSVNQEKDKTIQNKKATHKEQLTQCKERKPSKKDHWSGDATMAQAKKTKNPPKWRES